MDYDPAKMEEAVLALLGAFEFEQGRVWKRFDFDVMNSLHEKGFITAPRNRSESVYLTDDGLRTAKSLAARYFGHSSERRLSARATLLWKVDYGSISADGPG